MKKRITLFFLFLLIVVTFIGWQILGPTVQQPEEKFFYIPTGAVYNNVMTGLMDKKIIRSESWFRLVSKLLKYKIIKPGKYGIKKGMSLLALVRMLKNGKQTPVDLVIIKFRTKQEFANRIGKEFETDSLQMMHFLQNNDSLRHYGLDTNTWACAIIPDTYIYFWNSTPTRIFSKLYMASQKFWTPDNLRAIRQKNLTPNQAYILASIIEEETNQQNDKSNIASVYLNRLSKNMYLQADPTIRFAMNDFGIKRIYDKYLGIQSPFNTYTNKGLPPGPICTPSVETLDAVVNAPRTDYLYFVANSDLGGSSVFTSSLEEHLKYAKLYQQALNKQDSIRKTRQNNP